MILTTIPILPTLASATLGKEAFPSTGIDPVVKNSSEIPESKLCKTHMRFVYKRLISDTRFKMIKKAKKEQCWRASRTQISKICLPNTAKLIYSCGRNFFVFKIHCFVKGWFITMAISMTIHIKTEEKHGYATKYSGNLLKL